MFIPHLSPLAKAQVCAPNDTVLCVFPTLGKRHLTVCYSHLRLIIDVTIVIRFFSFCLRS